MSKALIPGSFDPITNGHLDVIKRTAVLFDEVIVLVSKNSSKNYMLCSKKRAALVEDAVRNISNVSVMVYDGLLVDFVKENGIDVTVKGVRNEKDYAYEENMAGANMLLSRQMYGTDFETLYMPSSNEYQDVSSTIVRLLLQNNSDASNLVPNFELLKKLLSE